MKSEGFRVLATKKKSLALHVSWTTNQKEKCMISGFFEEGGIFLFLAGWPPFSFSFFLYPRKP